MIKRHAQNLPNFKIKGSVWDQNISQGFLFSLDFNYKFSIKFYSRAEEHFPIRDAVEKRPPIEEYLENFRAHKLQTQIPEGKYT